MRNLELSQETAKRWYEGTDEELKALALQTYPELGKKELPKSWYDLIKIKGYYVGANTSRIIEHAYAEGKNKNVFFTKEQAEASIALAQLSQLREVYRNGWVPDYNKSENKYVIELFINRIDTHFYQGKNYFLSFQDAKTRDLFLENFRDLIEKAKPLMS